MMPRNGLVLLVLSALTIAACEGPAGPAGPAGEDGEDGKKGKAGEDGEDGSNGAPGDDGDDGDDGLDAGVDPALPTLDKALAGIGGQAVLQAMNGFTYTSSGSRALDVEGHEPGEPAAEISTFDLVVTHDLAVEGIRYDWDRDLLFFGGAPMAYSEIVVGQVGVVDGSDNFFGFPTGDMPSTRWASVTKQHLLLNPHLILSQVLAGTLSATEAGFGLHDGVMHEVLEVDDGFAPMDLYVSPSTGRIAKISTVENHHLKRDVPLEVHYANWTAWGPGEPLFPADVFVTLDGELFHSETRTALEVNPVVAAGTFDFPVGSAPAFVQADADFGYASHQFWQSFAALGLPFDFVQTFVLPTEISPGVWFLSGGSHNSLAIEQDTRVVIVEAPLYPERADAILAWAATQFPAKPVTHVFATHHHLDHAAGLRSFVAAGARVVISEHSETFLADVFRAPSTVWPDALAGSPVAADIVTVPDGGSFTIGDGTNPVTAWHMPNSHAIDMLVVHAEGSDHLFNSDVWNPGYGGSALDPAYARDLQDFVDQEIGTQPTMVGGHSGIGDYAELDAYVDLNFP